MYECIGPGSEIDVYAPPYINSSSPLSFVRGDGIGSGLFAGPITINLISTEPPYMVARLQVAANPSLSVFNITCEVRSPLQTAQVQYQLSSMLTF